MTNSGLTRELYLGIDQGGSSTKALLLDQNGQVQWQDSQQIRTITEADLAKNSGAPENFIFEHDGVEIVESVKSLIHKAKAVAGQKIKGLGLSIQRSGVLAWRAEAKQVVPLTHVRSWRDARNQELIEQYRDRESNIKSISGLPLTYHFAALKIAQLQKKFPNALVGTLDSWILGNLLGLDKFLTERSHAARTQLYSLENNRWSEELCHIFGVEIARLPQIAESLESYGTIGDIDVIAVLGDQQAALFGINKDEPVLNLGTVGQIIINVGASPKFLSGYNTGITYSWGADRQYQLEASVNCCGAILQEVQNIESAHGGAVNYSSLEGLKEVLFWSPISSGSPDWITGLPLINEGIVPGTLLYARALLDNLAFWINQNLVYLTECGIIKNQSIYALGGGSQNNYLMQALSNLSGFKIIRLKSSQGSAFGAAAAAYASVNGALLNLNGAGFDEFLPQASDIKCKWERWKKIYQSVKIRKS